MIYHLVYKTPVSARRQIYRTSDYENVEDALQAAFGMLREFAADGDPGGLFTITDPFHRLIMDDQGIKDAFDKIPKPDAY